MIPTDAPHVQTAIIKTGRNDACPCGSGKKYKHCCASRDESAAVGGHRNAAAIQRDIHAAHDHYKTGRRTEAEALYRHVLSVEPDNPDALHMLGLMVYEAGGTETAAELISRAVSVNKQNYIFHNNLGTILKSLGRYEEAEAAYRFSIAINRHYAEGYNNLGALLMDQGRLDEAEAAYRRSIAINPHYAEAYCNLGVVFKYQGRLEDAEKAQRKAIALKPDIAEAYNNLGLVLRELGRLPEAAEACRTALTLKPAFAAAYENLGLVLKDLGALADAELFYRQAIVHKPDFAEAYLELGNVLKIQSRLAEAEKAFRTATTLNPDYAEAWNNLGAVINGMGELAGADEAYRRAIDLRPDYADAWSNLLLNHNYYVTDTEFLFREHQTWGARLVAAVAPEPGGCYRSLGNGRVRIGYVSGDLGRHPVGYFLLPVLEHHDREQFEIFCYSDRKKEDEFSEKLMKAADVWRRASALGSAELAGMIREDGIDILIDLAGHTAQNRMEVFAMKPAPVQVSWLGYPNTTGLGAIDYRISDDIADPPGEADRLHTETLLRLPDGFLCYVPSPTAPEVASAVHGVAGITFGSFNNLAKITTQVITTWSQILNQVPSSRLLLKHKAFSDAACRQRIRSLFATHGITAGRVQPMAFVENSDDHLALYRRIDIALDTFPYNGTTTTCDALWMGVPVVTIRGNRHAARVGASILTHVGMDNLIADSLETYIEKAVRLAGDTAYLERSRHGLRERLARSPLCDAVRFTRSLEGALRDAWRQWCSGP